MQKPKKKQLSVRIDALLLDELKELCRDFGGRPFYLVYSDEVQNALRVHLAVLKNRVADVQEPTSNRNHQPTRGRP